MSDPAAAPRPNGFRLLWVELVQRTTHPVREVVYSGFFVGFVVMLGGLAVCVELYQLARASSATADPSNLYMALVTFFPALIASSCAQMNMETRSRRLQIFSLFVLLVSTIIGIALIFTPRPAGGTAWTTASALSLTALWIWWIANAHNRSLHDDPDAAVGGDPNAPLSGDVSGMRL